MGKRNVNKAKHAQAHARPSGEKIRAAKSSKKEEIKVNAKTIRNAYEMQKPQHRSSYVLFFRIVAALEHSAFG